MNQWGLWFSFFVPAFLSGTALGVCAMAALFLLSKRKKTRRTERCESASALSALKRCA